MISIYQLFIILAACSSASARSGISYTCHSDVEGKGSLVGDASIPASDYSSGDGCVNQGPDGLGSVHISPKEWTMWDLFWAVEENYCVLAYEDINCVGSMDIKEPWNLEEGSLLVPIAGMSSVKVVNGVCDAI